MYCYLFEAPSYLFFAPDLPGLLYYSHIPTALVALIVGTIVLVHNPRARQNILLFLISVCFSLWVLASLTAWTSIHGDFLAFIWPAFGVLAALLSILCVYFTYTFVYGTDVSLKIKLIFLTLLAPVLLLAHTNVSVSGFNLTDCDAFGLEGFWYKAYYTALGFIAMTWIIGIIIDAYRKADAARQNLLLYLGVGIEFFLGSFIFTTFIVTYLTGLGYYEDSRLEMYGLFGMTFFMIMLGIIIVRYKVLNVGLHAASALVIALLILVTSQFTYANSTSTTLILTTISLVLTATIGVFLIKSVRREVHQREELEMLTNKLEKANVRLKQLDKLKSEFVSIASHQLRSPLTAIRGYASMLVEGSFGKLPEKAKEPLKRIEQSAYNMALSVEDYLNVSRIESGNMKFECSDFNLKELAEQIVDDLRQQAMKKGLVLTFKSDMNGKGLVNADQGKTTQILHNLINNSLKYTPKGSITVFVHDDSAAKQIHVEVIDTGIGMDPNTIEHLFDKFERAKDANKVNTEGTGLGLFVARAMARKMQGDVTAHSEGEGKGSHFVLTLPMQM